MCCFTIPRLFYLVVWEQKTSATVQCCIRTSRESLSPYLATNPSLIPSLSTKQNNTGVGIVSWLLQLLFLVVVWLEITTYYILDWGSGIVR